MKEIKTFTKKEKEIINGKNKNITINDAIEEGKIKASFNFFLNS